MFFCLLPLLPVATSTSTSPSFDVALPAVEGTFNEEAFNTLFKSGQETLKTTAISSTQLEGAMDFGSVQFPSPRPSSMGPSVQQEWVRSILGDAPGFHHTLTRSMSRRGRAVFAPGPVKDDESGFSCHVRIAVASYSLVREIASKAILYLDSVLDQYDIQNWFFFPSHGFLQTLWFFQFSSSPYRTGHSRIEGEPLFLIGFKPSAAFLTRLTSTQRLFTLSHLGCSPCLAIEWKQLESSFFTLDPSTFNTLIVQEFD